MKNKKISVIIGVISIMTLFSACGSSSATKQSSKETKLSSIADKYITAKDSSKNPVKNRPDTFIATIHTPGGVFLPYFYDNGWDGNATAPIFASLVSVDDNGKLSPDLAESWKVSSDNLVYTYHLRKNLKFSDGSPITADDVAFTLTLLDDPAYSGGVDISQSYIKGSDDYKNGKATSIEGIKIIDELTIQITTEKINPLNLSILGGQVLSKAYYGKGYEKGKLDYLKALYGTPVGSGPYKLDKYVPGQEVRYIANSNYYGGKPNIEHLIFKVTSASTALENFQTGDTDLDSFSTDKDTIDQLQSLGFANIRIKSIADYGLIYINNKKTYLKDKAVRQALIYGLDRQKIVDTMYSGYGQVANVIGAPTLWSYTEDGINRYKFDQAKAKKLLDDDGWKVGSDGIREKNGQKLKLSYLTSKDTDKNIPIAKEDYKAIGIDFEPEVMDSNTLIQKLTKGEYDLVGGFRSNGLVDPDDAVEEFSSNQSSNENVSGYSNPKVDKLIKEGISTLDQNKRKETYKKLYQELSNDPPVILIDYRKSVSAWNSRIQGIENNNFAGLDSTNLAKLKIKK